MKDETPDTSEFSEAIPPLMPSKRQRRDETSIRARIIGAFETAAGFVVVFLFSWLLWRWLVLPIVRWLVDPLWLRVPTESAVAIDAACVLALVIICCLVFEHRVLGRRAGETQLSLKDEEERKRFGEEVTGEPRGEESRIVRWKNKVFRWVGGTLCLIAAYFTAIRPLLRAWDFTPRWTYSAMKASDDAAWAKWDAWERRSQNDSRLKASLKSIQRMSYWLEQRGWEAPARFLVYDASYEDILRMKVDFGVNDGIEKMETRMAGWFPQKTSFSPSLRASDTPPNSQQGPAQINELREKNEAEYAKWLRMSEHDNKIKNALVLFNKLIDCLQHQHGIKEARADMLVGGLGYDEIIGQAADFQKQIDQNNWDSFVAELAPTMRQAIW